jgi:xanthine dehydrogenase accessory factor
MTAPAQLDWLDAVGRARARGEACVLVTVAEARGSSPREAGAKMVVHADGTSAGSIGGGHLEHVAQKRATELIAARSTGTALERFPLGPKLGQCCGGTVTLLFETFLDAALPLALFGAGHVGAATIEVLHGLPFAVTWIDSRRELLDASDAPGIIKRESPDPADEVRDIPLGAAAVVMTHRHDLDLAIVEKLLRRDDLRYIGVIGSATKRARFEARLRERGFDAATIARLRCPIGLGRPNSKHPRAIAIALAAELLQCLPSPRPSLEVHA